MEFSEVIKFFNFKELYRLLKNSSHFYFRPKLYFKKLFDESGEDQFKQTSFLLILGSALLYLFLEDLAITKIFKYVLIDVAMCLIASSQLALSNFIVNRFKLQISFRNLFLFVLHAKIFFAPFLLGFFGIFRTTELYEFYFLSNTIFIFILTFIYFFSSYIFYKKTFSRFLSIILNLIIVNIFAIILHFVAFDNKLDKLIIEYLDDPIFTEYFTAKENLRFTEKFPTSKTLYFTDDRYHQIFLFSKLADTLSKGDNIITDKFLLDTDDSLKKIDSLMTKMKYQRSKIILAKWDEYFKSAKKDYYQKPNLNEDNVLSAYEIISRTDSTKSKEYKFTIKNDSTVFSNYIKALEAENELFEMSEKGEYPLIVLGLIALPSGLLFRESDDENMHNRVDSSYLN